MTRPTGSTNKGGVMQMVKPMEKGQFQEGYIDGGVPEKPLVTSEELTPDQLTEKQIYQKLLRMLVPKFPSAKLDKAELATLSRFFTTELPPLLQQEVQRRYFDISP